MSFATLNLEAGFPTIDDARRRLLSEMQSARARGVRVIKVVHGWGSSGEGGKLGPGREGTDDGPFPRGWGGGSGGEDAEAGEFGAGVCDTIDRPHMASVENREHEA